MAGRTGRLDAGNDNGSRAIISKDIEEGKLGTTESVDMWLTDVRCHMY